MYPRSTILVRFVLLILLLVTSSSDSRKDFWPDYEVYGDLDGDGNMNVLVKSPRFEYICLLVSLPFLLLTFVVYSVLPELDNIHGYTLRSHVVSLFIINVINIYFDEFPMLSTGNFCLLTAYICNFSRLSSIFWLNVICFEFWWTLRQFRSYRTNLKKQKKMFIMYSIYAWGISFILNVVCAILDIPSISIHLGTSPEMCVEWVWFSYRGMVYFYVPVGVSVIVNICLFIAMVLTIWYHDKQTDNQLRNSRSSRHNNNRFTVYVKLSIVLVINWITRIILWLTTGFALAYDKNVDIYLKLVLWHITELIDILQGVILFFAFVWKKKIMLLLLKRFGCQVRESVTNISINNDRPCASPSPTTPLTAEIVPMQEITPSNQQINHRAESYSQ